MVGVRLLGELCARKQPRVLNRVVAAGRGPRQCQRPVRCVPHEQSDKRVGSTTGDGLLLILLLLLDG